MKLMKFVVELKFFKINFFGRGRAEDLLLECIVVEKRCHQGVSPAALKLSFLTTHFYPLQSLD